MGRQDGMERMLVSEKFNYRHNRHSIITGELIGQCMIDLIRFFHRCDEIFCCDVEVGEVGFLRSYFLDCYV